MDVVVVLPPDFIGAPEIRFTLSIASNSVEEALTVARLQLERRLPDNLVNLSGIPRTLSIGDVLIVGQGHYIVERTGFRPVSAAYCENWRKRSLVERLIGSGEYERVRTRTSTLLPAVAL
jgi:hypothetical protein